MQFRCLSLCLIAAALMVVARPTPAQETRVQELQRQIEQRDKVIIELLERVDALERRVGIDHLPSEAAQTERSVAPSTESASAKATEHAPGAVVVEKGAAERALERSLTREGALLLPSGIVELEPGLTYSRQEDATPRFVTSGGAILAGQTERNADGLTGDLALRLGLPWDSQLELGFPYRWRQVQTVTNVGFAPTDSSSRSGSGIGDLRVGLAKTLLREGLRRPDLVARFTWNTGTGKADDAGVSLGGGFQEWRTSVTAIKREDPLAFIGSLSYQHALENGRIQPGPAIAMDFGSFIALSPETSLQLLFAGAYQDETKISGHRIAGSDQTIGTLVLGASVLIARGTLLNLSAGIGLTKDADDFSVTLSLPMRFSEPLY